jgi:hypothetical protein
LEIAGLVVPFAISITGYKMLDLSKRAVQQTIEHVGKFFVTFSRMKTGVIDFVSAAAKILSYVASVIKWTCISRDMKDFPEWDSPWEMTGITVFSRRVEELNQQAHNGKLLINQKTYLDICDLIVEGDELQRTVPVRESKMAIFNKIRELKTIRESLVTKGVFSSGARPEPVPLVLCGPPGQGKSTICQILHTLIWSNGMMPEELHPEFVKDPMKFMFTRVSANDFWEGYTAGHFTAVWDDIGALREEFSGISEFIEMIKAINSFPFALHMAEMMSKANTYFTSRLVIASSNIEGDWNSKALISQDALARRMNKNRYRVLLNDNFPTVRSIDPDNPLRKFDLDYASIENLLTLGDVKFERWVDGTWLPVKWNVLVNDIRKQLNDAKSSYERHMEHLRLIAASEEPDFPDDYKTWVTKVEKAKKTDPISTVKKMKQVQAFIESGSHEEFHARTGIELPEREKLFSDIADEDEVAYWGTSKSAFHLRIKQAYLSTRNWIGNVMWEQPDIDMDDLDELQDAIEHGLVVDLTKFTNREWKPWVKYAIGATSIATAAGIAGLLYHFLHKRPFKAEHESGGYKARSIKNNGVGVQSIPSVQVLKASYESGTIDAQATDILKKTLRYNTFTMMCDGTKLGFMTFVEDRFAVFPAHFIFLINEHFQKQKEERKITLSVDCISLVSENANFSILVVDFFRRCVQHDTKDLALVHLGSHTCAKKSIVNRITTRSDKKALRGVIVIPESNNSDRVSWVSNVTFKYKSGAIIDFGPHLLDIGDLVTYCDVKTERGDCGSLIFSTAPPRNERPIMGFHIGAGESAADGGIGLLLYVEDYHDLKRSLTDKESVFEIVEEPVELPESNEETILGTFQAGWQSPKAYRGCTKSSIRKSFVHGDWGPSKQAPAHLRPFFDDDGNLINPFEKALLRYGAPKVAVLEMLVAKCASSLGSWLHSQSPVSCPYRREVHNGDRDDLIFEFDEAILGIPGDPYFKSISRKSSPGYPHILENLPHGKAAWFGTGPEFDLSTHRCQRLKAKVYETINKARRGIRCLWVYADNLKDERVSLEKVHLGKTRLFSACPLELLVLYRMYFGAFASWVARNNVHNGIAIGLNVYSSKWDLAAHLLKQNEGRVFAGDFSAFDTKHIPIVHNHILNIINHWYDDGNERIREVLWLEITNSRHIYLDEIYTWNGGLPSGNPVTSLVNSLYNHMLFRMCWYYRQFSERYREIGEFNDNVYLLTMGDDNTGSTKDEAFDPMYISESMEVFGQTWTHESKLETFEWGTPFRNITEVSFLKRVWRYDDDLKRYVAPLSLDTVLEICYWYRSGNDPAEQVANNLETVLRELSFHSPDVWETYAKVIMHDVQVRCGYNSKYSTRSEYLIAASNSEFVV